MRIMLKSTMLELTDAIKEYVERRFDPLTKLLKRFETKGEYTLQVEIARTTRHHRKGSVYYVEATLSLPNKTIRIEQSHDDLHAGIDAAKKRLQVEIEKYKEKVEEKDRKIQMEKSDRSRL